MAHLGIGDAVAVDVGRDPLAVRDEVGDHRRVRRYARPEPRERRDRDGGSRVDRDDEIGRQTLEEGAQAPGAEARDPEGHDGVAGHPVAERVAETPEERRTSEDRVIERPARAIEERVDHLAKMVHDRDLRLLALEGGGETPGGDVVAGAVAGGDDQNASHRPDSSYLVSRAPGG